MIDSVVIEFAGQGEDCTKTYELSCIFVVDNQVTVYRMFFPKVYSKLSLDVANYIHSDPVIFNKCHYLI